MAKYSIGLKSVKYGTPSGTAVMPTTLTAFANTVLGSMNITEDEPEVKDFEVEELDAPIRQAITKNGKLKAEWKAYDIDPAIMAVVKGGTVTATKFSAPAKSTIIELALEITSEDDVKFTIPRASVVARIDGQVGREDMVQLSISATAIDPGDGGSPWAIEHV